MPKTSAQWWGETKSDPEKLIEWLRRQYVGEMAAVNLLSEVLLRFGGQATKEQWDLVFTVMAQEAKHARWMKGLLDMRGIALPDDARADTRYWKEVVPNVTSFKEAVAAAFHAEHMRLARIRAICNDASAPGDIREVFQRILPDEEWHESVFDKMRDGVEMTRYHEKGLEALNLVLS